MSCATTEPTVYLSDGCTMPLSAARRWHEALGRAIKVAEGPACTCCKGSGLSTVCRLVCARCGGTGKEPFQA